MKILDKAPEAPVKKSWGAVAATWWAVVVYLVPQVVIGLLLSTYTQLRHWPASRASDWLTNSIPAQFVATLLIEAAALGLIWWLLKHYHAKPGDIGLKVAKVRDIFYAVIGFGCYLVVYLTLVSMASKLVPELNVNQQQDIGFQHVTTAVSLIMAAFSLVILPPLAEEIIFRGFVFTGFRRHFGFVIATLGTSILFAVPHLLEGDGGGLLWVAGIDTFVLSFVLCYLREKTGRLWAGMGVHALKNSLAFAALFIFHSH